MTEELEKKSVLEEVGEERIRQDIKWGEQNRTFIEWVSIETEELGEVAQEANNAFFSERPDKPKVLRQLREEWIQVAAVAVAAIEDLDRNFLGGLER